MTVNKVKLKRQPGTLFIEEEKSLLLLAGQQEVVMLSSLATIILITNENSNSIDDNLTHLSEELSLPFTALKQEYETLNNLLSSKSCGSKYVDGQYPELEKAPDIGLSLCSSLNCCVEISGSYFHIELEDKELHNVVSELLAPIVTRKDQPDFIIQVRKINNSYRIESNGLVVSDSLAFDEVMPELIDRLQILCYQMTDYFCCFHGAAVEQHQSVYLFPGASGRGKSTLCCALHKGKNGVYSDEYIVLNREHQLLEIYLPLAIKKGSWQHLASAHTELNKAREWRRIDSRQIKYVWPTRVDLKSGRLPDYKKHFIFPNYTKEHTAEEATVKQLSVIETVQKLTLGGYQLRNDLTEQSLGLLIDYIDAATRIELSYSNTEQAVSALERHCGE